MGVQTERLAFKKTLGVRKAWGQYAEAALPVPMRPYVRTAFEQLESKPRRAQTTIPVPTQKSTVHAKTKLDRV